MLSKKKKVKQDMDLLLANFGGELVTVILNKDIEHHRQSENSIEVIKTPLSVSGYLTDIDDSFIYLGLSENQIHQAVNRDFVVHVELADENELQEIEENNKYSPGEYN